MLGLLVSWSGFKLSQLIWVHWINRNQCMLFCLFVCTHVMMRHIVEIFLCELERVECISSRKAILCNFYLIVHCHTHMECLCNYVAKNNNVISWPEPQREQAQHHHQLHEHFSFSKSTCGWHNNFIWSFNAHTRHFCACWPAIEFSFRHKKRF